MTDSELTDINCCIDKLNSNIGDMQDNYTRWDEEEEAFNQDQAEEENKPNSRINIINSTIMGEVTQIIDQNISTMAKGEGPDDKNFEEYARIGLDWAFRKNRIQKKLYVHELRRNKFGVGWLKVYWDKSFSNGFGCPIMTVPPINKIFIDSKIKEPYRIQEAEYICETISLSRSFAEMEYGEEKASAIMYGLLEYRDQGVFDESTTIDDDDSFVLCMYWTKCKGKLRLREFTGDGLLLFDSFKGKDRKENQKHNEIKPRSYYKHVNNAYPYFYTPKYIKEGDFYGYGDCKLLLPLQKMINELYDKIRIKMRPNLILIDKSSEIDVSSFDSEDSFNPYPFNGNRLRGQPVYSVEWGTINQDVFRLIQNIHEEAQRVTRFSDLMIGQAKSADTATEAAIQHQQGGTHTTFEKSMLELTMSDVAKYMLGLMMEFVTSGKAFRLMGDQGMEDSYKWLDFRDMTKIPSLVPATSGYKDKFMEKNPKQNIPEWETLEENGKLVTKEVELDIEISVGSGLPKNKAFLWQMIRELSQMQGIDIEEQMPMPKPAITWKELRQFMKDHIGIPIRGDDEMKKYVEQMKKMRELANQQQQMAGNNIPPMANQRMSGNANMQSADVQGMTPGGSPQQPQQAEQPPVGAV